MIFSQENAKIHKENVHEKQCSAIEQILIKTEETNEIEMDSENTLSTMCIKSEPKCDSENSLVSVNIKSEPNCDEDPLNIENQN